MVAPSLLGTKRRGREKQTLLRPVREERNLVRCLTQSLPLHRIDPWSGRPERDSMSAASPNTTTRPARSSVRDAGGAMSLFGHRTGH
eukprot:154647-Chlamydomonas_euryale.AAC.2